MPFVRRSFAGLSGLFLLQLLLLGSGTLCAMHDALTGDGASPRTMQMVGMGHQTGSHASVASGADDSSAPTGPVGCTGGRDGCGLPFAPGQCSSMTTCGISAKPAAAIAATVYVSIVAPELPSPSLGHAGPTFAPELPPPRV